MYLQKNNLKKLTNNSYEIFEGFYYDSLIYNIILFSDFGGDSGSWLGTILYIKTSYLLN